MTWALALLLAARAGAAPLPYDLAFQMKSFSAADPWALSPDGRLLAYVEFAPSEEQATNGRVRPNGTPIGQLGTRIQRTCAAAGPKATLLLLAAAEAYYPRIGFKHHPQAWVLREENVL